MVYKCVIYSACFCLGENRNLQSSVSSFTADHRHKLYKCDSEYFILPRILLIIEPCKETLFLLGKEDAANNYARGHYTIG